MCFDITWRVGDEGWAKAAEVYETEPAHGHFDEAGLAVNWMLTGLAQFRCGDQVLFPPERMQQMWREGSDEAEAHGESSWGVLPFAEADGTRLSMIDLAWKLDRLLDVGNFRAAADGATLMFVEESGELQIRFRRRLEHVLIESNLLKGIQMTVPQDEFFDGVERFIMSVMQAIRERIPGLLQWETFASLRRYEGSF